MSRNFEGSDDGEMWDYIRWRGAAKQAFTSKHGVSILREVEAALLAMPQKRLIRGAFVAGDDAAVGWAPPPEGFVGEACLVGAFTAFKAADGDVAKGIGDELRRRGYYEGFYDPEDDDAEETTGPAVNAGMRFTMAWELANFNDEDCYRTWPDRRLITPEERYERALAYVRKKIAAAISNPDTSKQADPSPA